MRWHPLQSPLCRRHWPVPLPIVPAPRGSCQQAKGSSPREQEVGRTPNIPIWSREHHDLSLPSSIRSKLFTPPSSIALPASFPMDLPHHPPPAIDLDPHPGSSSSCFRAPNSPAMCRCDPAETPASSLASIAATYPHTLTDTSPGCHPGIRGLPWPPQLTTDPPNPPQSAQGSAEISPALPANGITGNQLS